MNELKIYKEINLKPIQIDGTTFIPILELLIFSKKIQVGENLSEFTLVTITVTPKSLKIIQDEKEWELQIPS